MILTNQEIKRISAMIREELRKEMDELMNIHKAAEYLGISPAALRKRCERGECPHHTRGKGNNIYFSRHELNRFYLE